MVTDTLEALKNLPFKGEETMPEDVTAVDSIRKWLQMSAVVIGILVAVFGPALTLYTRVVILESDHGFMQREITNLKKLQEAHEDLASHRESGRLNVQWGLKFETLTSGQLETKEELRKLRQLIERFHLGGQ